MTTPTLTYPGGAVQRAIVIAARHADVDADRLIAGTYLFAPDEEYSGCDIGCLAVSAVGLDAANEAGRSGDWHTAVGAALGWSVSYCHLRDHIFEGLPYDKRIEWSTAALEAVPVGVDLQPAVDLLMRDLVSADPVIGVQQHADGDDKLAAIEAVHALYVRRIAGDEPARSEWSAASSRAHSFPGYLDSAVYAAAAAANAGGGIEVYPQADSSGSRVLGHAAHVCGPRFFDVVGARLNEYVAALAPSMDEQELADAAADQADYEATHAGAFDLPDEERIEVADESGWMDPEEV